VEVAGSAAREGSAMAIQRFEEIRAWQAARELTKLVYELTKQPRFARDMALSNQLRRAAVSVMANIAEGFDRRSRKEFSNFLNIAYASVTEVKSHLYVALDQGYISSEQFDRTYAQCAETAKMILGFMQYLVSDRARAHA
jgi:four helix bundle protein